MRRLPLIAFGALVAATIAAFFITQHLKSSTPLITGASHPRGFSRRLRNCPPARGEATISFYLLHAADDVDVYVANQAGSIVRTVVLRHHMRRRVRFPDGVFRWDGREDNGSLVPNGTYHFRVALRNQKRTIDLTSSPVVVRCKAPAPEATTKRR